MVYDNCMRLAFITARLLCFLIVGLIRLLIVVLMSLESYVIQLERDCHL
jgi:hypothetical protein